MGPMGPMWAPWAPMGPHGAPWAPWAPCVTLRDDDAMGYWCQTKVRTTLKSGVCSPRFAKPFPFDPLHSMLSSIAFLGRRRFQDKSSHQYQHESNIESEGKGGSCVRVIELGLRRGIAALSKRIFQVVRTFVAHLCKVVCFSLLLLSLACVRRTIRLTETPANEATGHSPPAISHRPLQVADHLPPTTHRLAGSRTHRPQATRHWPTAVPTTAQWPPTAGKLLEGPNM